MSEIAALLGRVVAGKYAIEEHIGGGAMGEVFRARHVVLDTAIALKIMRPDIANDSMFKQRFYREAKAASRLDHQNSVRVLDFGVESDGLVYLAMEFLHGRNLLSVLRDEWPLSDERIVDLLVQTLAAVAVAHDLGIVHRDLKPENIMVSVGHEEDGVKPYHVKVCDFGIAKLSDPRGFQTDGGNPLTSSGTLIGTPEYMSPEQARGDPLDARSDLYSIGIVLYQLLVGRVPFSAENALGVVLKQVTDEPVAPTQVRPHVNPRLEAICLRALKKSRDERYQSAKEMRRDLRGVFGYRPQSQTDESGAHLPATEAAPRAADTSNVATLVLSEENAATEPGGMRFSGPISDGSHGSRGADFSSKQTSDGTEVTLPMPVASRYLGAIAAVAGVALLLGAGAVVLMTRADTSKEAKLASTGATLASAPSSSAADPTGPSGTFGTSPPAEGASPTTPAPLATVASKQAAVAVATSPHAASPASPLPAPPSIASHATSAKSPTASALASAPAPALASPPAPASPAPVPAPASDPAYNPAGAYVVLGAMQREHVSERVMHDKLTAILPKLSGCYQSALMMAGAPVPGSAEIHMSIDDKGNITSIVTAPKHPQFARCAQDLLANQKVPVSALEDGSTMGATVTQWLTLHP